MAFLNRATEYLGGAVIEAIAFVTDGLLSLRRLLRVTRSDRSWRF